MEHRWGRRSQIEIETRLFSGQRCRLGIGRILNISTSGAFVEINFALPLLACIQLEIETAVHGGVSALCVPAYVVRKTKNRIGVEWCEAPAFVFRDIIRGHTPYSDPVQASRSHQGSTVKPCPQKAI